MLKKYLFVLSITLLFAGTATAGEAQEQFKKYLNDIAQEVKSTNDAAEKREILDNMFHKILEAAEYVETMPVFSDEEKASIAELKQKASEKHDELNGYNGFSKVADEDLNRFADYMVQDLEQAAEYVTISVFTLVLIILLVAILL